MLYWSSDLWKFGWHLEPTTTLSPLLVRTGSRSIGHAHFCFCSGCQGIVGMVQSFPAAFSFSPSLQPSLMLFTAFLLCDHHPSESSQLEPTFMFFTAFLLSSCTQLFILWLFSDGVNQQTHIPSVVLLSVSRKGALIVTHTLLPWWACSY